MKKILDLWLWRLLSVVLAVGLWGGATPAIAAPTHPSPAPLLARPPVIQTTDLQATLDEFLQNIPPGYYGIRQIDALQAKIDQENALLIDVRESAQYDAGHIPGAINIPLKSLAQSLERVPHDRPVVLYCSSGFRTGMGVMTLHLLGYDNVQGFPPSYVGWQRAQTS
jgi:rhodanese-related sulfurtransferase